VTEVEIKARVEDPAEIEHRIAALAEFHSAYVKEDRYYCPAEGEPTTSGDDAAGVAQGAPAERARFRLRVQDDAALVTYKRKRLEGDHEVNEEHEFSISDVREFEAFAEGIGYQVCARKHKSGRRYRTPDGAGIELAEVRGLGWFVEIEILVAAGNPSGRDAAKQRILELFDQLSIGQERFERRYYIDMLAEAGKDSDYGHN
jgi:predicted adenylyl cyclase CyaB